MDIQGVFKTLSNILNATFCKIVNSPTSPCILGYILQNPIEHGHKKRKDSLETRVVLLILSPELEDQNSEKWRLLLV